MKKINYERGYYMILEIIRTGIYVFLAFFASFALGMGIGGIVDTMRK